MELTSLLRARIVVTTAMVVAVAVAAGDIFDQRVWWLVISPTVVGLVGLVTVARRWPTRGLAALGAVLGSTAAVVLATGGAASEIVPSFVAGPQRILSTDWPSPDRGDLIGVVAAGLAVATALAAELARRVRFHLAPLFPIVVAMVCVIGLSAPLGHRLVRLLPIAVLAVLLATLRTSDGVGLRERITLLRGERRLILVGSLAIGLAAATAVPIAFDGRDDPRRNEAPARTAAVLDPIEATLALQAIDPPITLHTITITDQGPDLDGRRPLRWRTAALADYDGRQWSPDLELRPIGRRLEAPATDTVDATIEFLDDDLQLVPLPGAPILVDADVETDPTRTLVRLVDRPGDGTVVDITARVPPPAAGADPGQVGTREIGDRAGGFTDLATGLAEEGGSEPGDDTLTRLFAIESTLREDFVLRSDAPGGGLQQTLIDRFLRDTQRGNAEQFATSFVLLARSLGVDARVATGFEVDGVPIGDDGTAEFDLQSDDARIWPEVRIGDQWVAFDPVPEAEATDAVVPEPEPQVQTPAAPQPPTPPPPESSDEPRVTEDASDESDDTALPTVLRYAVVVGAVAVVWAIPILLLVTGVLLTKWRRRRKLLNGDPRHRIRGAWSVATMRLVDAGIDIAPADTNEDIAAAGAAEVPTADREIRRLATLANAATFGTPARPDLLAQDAANCLGQVESSMTESRDWRRRAAWRLSLRSLRKSTASPV